MKPESRICSIWQPWLPGHAPPTRVHTAAQDRVLAAGPSPGSELVEEVSFLSPPLPASNIISFKMSKPCSAQNTARGIRPCGRGPAPPASSCCKHPRPQPRVSYFENDGEHPPRSRCSAQAGGLPPRLLHACPACREAGVRERGNGSACFQLLLRPPSFP